MFPVSGIYVALSALLMLVLAYRVVSSRLKNNVGIHDGGLPQLAVAIRTHANLLEHALPVLLLLMVAEANGAPVWLLHGCGIVFLLARLLHAWGFTISEGGTHSGRVHGTMVTWLVMLVLIVTVLVRSVALLGA